jgi:hypothetical protein
MTHVMVTFWGGDRKFSCRHPVVNDLHRVEIAPDSKSGTIEFSGHYYLEDEHLPQDYRLDIRDFDAAIDDYKRRMYHHIRVVRREVFEDTSEYWNDPDVGGDICLFPTNRIRLHFEILTS